MRSPNCFLTSAGWFAFSLLLILSCANPSAAAGFGRKVAGSYLLQQDDGFLQILTLTKKGNALSQNNGQFVGQDRFGDQQGAWQKAKGKRKLVIKTLDFTFDTVEGVFTGFGRSTFDVEFDSGFDSLSGTVFVEIFSSGQDPLDPNAIPIATFGPTTFTGRRITAQ